jgi:bifunctional enzyme CysN/CysC
MDICSIKTTSLDAVRLASNAAERREQMNIVIVGHVDHGKSTVIGRLLADTGSLPEGKLEQVRRTCQLNAKPFEFAFLLDALQDEQAQGITIDSARCFFKTKQRDYIIIDAPGHIEFLKNMVTGASRAEAAVLVIDAKEGVQENSRRHGYMLSLLGIHELVVVVNKMDLVGYDQSVFHAVSREFGRFLAQLGVRPMAFVPISALLGTNLVAHDGSMPWYQGPTVVEVIDRFSKQAPHERQPFRMPVQDVYKFTEAGDDRRIVAGTVLGGSAKVGDEVVFLPSGKRSTIASIEGFNEPAREHIHTREATGVTLSAQVYVRSGELMCRMDERVPTVGTAVLASVFWLGRRPLVKNKRYKLKLHTASTSAYVREVRNVINAADLASESARDHVERHEVAECVLETVRPIAFDIDNGESARFVIVDNFEIAGGGIITKRVLEDILAVEEATSGREQAWVSGNISEAERHTRYHQRPKLILVTGTGEAELNDVAARLERRLFEAGRYVYFLGLPNLVRGLGADVSFAELGRDEHVRRLGELARLFTDGGSILIATMPDMDSADAHLVRSLSRPAETLVVAVGEELYDRAADLLLPKREVSREDDLARDVDRIMAFLVEREVIDYQI